MNSTAYSPGLTSCDYFLTRWVFITKGVPKHILTDGQWSWPSFTSRIQLCPMPLFLEPSGPVKSTTLTLEDTLGIVLSTHHRCCTQCIQRDECRWWRITGRYIAFSGSKAYALRDEKGRKQKYQSSERRQESKEYLNCRYKRFWRYLAELKSCSTDL